MFTPTMSTWFGCARAGSSTWASERRCPPSHSSSLHQGASVKKLILGAVTLVASAIGGTVLAADIPLEGSGPGARLQLDRMLCRRQCRLRRKPRRVHRVYRAASSGILFHTTNFPVSIPVNPKGAVGGGQIGCNAQLQQWVFGVETDLQCVRHQSLRYAVADTQGGRAIHDHRLGKSQMVRDRSGAEPGCW